MSDYRFRELERAVQSDPSDFSSWVDYINTACRIGRLDPLNFDNFITLLSGVAAPAHPNYYTQGAEGIPIEDREIILEAYHEAWDNWQIQRQNAIQLLHNIRNYMGQWSAQQFVGHINKIFPKMLKHPPKAILQTWQERQEKEASGELEGPEDMETDVVSISGMFVYIAYDEINSEPGTPKPINDFSPQYIIYGYEYWTESHGMPGTGEQMSEIVERDRFNDPHQVALYLLGELQTEAQQYLADERYAEQIAEEERLWEEF